MDAASPAERLGRVLELAALSDLSAAAEAGTLRFDRPLEIRDTGEARAFRDWLPRVDQIGNEEGSER